MCQFAYLRKADPFVLNSLHLKFNVLLILLLGVTTAALAQTPDQPPQIRLLIGLDNVKNNAGGQLTIQDGSLHFKGKQTDAQIPIASIDDIFIGTEVTQGGGKTGRVVKTAAMAAPYGSGKALTIMLRTKVDILTVSYHSTEGGMHGAIFALPKGQADKIREDLIHAGAHASPVAEIQAADKQ
jgi:hypothetical protein